MAQNKNLHWKNLKTLLLFYIYNNGLWFFPSIRRCVTTSPASANKPMDLIFGMYIVRIFPITEAFEAPNDRTIVAIIPIKPI